MDGETTGQTGILSAAWEIVSGMWAFGLGVVACLLFLVWCFSSGVGCSGARWIIHLGAKKCAAGRFSVAH